MDMQIINKWLSSMDVAPMVGGAIIATVTIIAAAMVRFVGDKIALVLSRWTGLGIRTQLFDIIRAPLWISALLVGVLVEVRWLMPPSPIDFFAVGAAQTALAITWIIVLLRTLGLVLSRLRGYYPNATELFRLSENVGTAILAVVGGFAILSVWQINLTPLLASAGLVGIIVALAAKDVLGNFFGGISVFLDRPFRLGDYIVLDSGGSSKVAERGKVVDIGLRSTKIRTRDDILVTIPNSVIAGTKIINESAPVRRMRVRIKVSTWYTAEVDKLEEIMLNAARSNSLVLTKPPPVVRLRELGNGQLNYELLCWTAQPRDKGRLIHEVNTAVLKAFYAAGIDFPMPQRDVYVHRVRDASRNEAAQTGDTFREDRLT